jgi:hypothetical protein
MATAALVAAGISAAGAAYSGNRQSKAAKEANKAANGPWNETTRRDPWADALPYLQDALPEARRIYDQSTSDLAALKSKRSSGGYSGGGGGSYSGPNADTVVGKDQQEIAARMKELAMNGDPLTKQAKGYLGGMFDGAGGGNGGTFGYNPVYDDLNRRLGGASFDRGTGMIEKFLAGNAPKPQAPAKKGQEKLGRITLPEGQEEASAAARGRYLSEDEQIQQAQERKARINARLAGKDGAIEDQARYLESQGMSAEEARGRAIDSAEARERPQPVGGGAGVPDTVGRSNGFFASKVKELWDPATMDPANNPALAPYIEQLRKNMAEERDAALAEVGDQYAGLGMFGSSGKALEAGRARAGSDNALANAISGAYMQDYSGAWDRRMSALNMTNQRDLGAMQDATQRYGIDQSASAASAGARAAAESQQAALDLQRELGMRGQDLDAIGLMMGHDRAGLGMLAGLGDAYSGDMKWATGMAGQFNDQDMGNLERALSPYQSFDQQRAAAAAERSRWQSGQDALAAQRAEQERMWDYQDLTAQQGLFSDYLGGLGALVNLGPSSSTSSGQGSRGGGGYVDPGPGAWAAGLTSLGGNLMAAYGSGAIGGGSRRGGQQ